MKTHTTQIERSAFTLIELLIVIAIIGVLISLVSVGVTSVYRSSLKSSELNNVRQVGNALLMYAGSNKSQLVRGWQSTDVQAITEDTIVYPDFVEISPAPNFRASDKNIAGPWTWHLASYIDNPESIMRSHLDKEERAIDNYVDEGDDFAHQPAFAYNGWYLGGQWAFWDPHYRTAQLRFASVEQADGTKATPVVRSLPLVRNSTDVVGFCTAFKADGPMDMLPSAGTTPGTWLVEPRLMANELRWGIDQGGDMHIHAATHAPFGRGGGPPVAWFIDGHASTQTYEDLADQRRWIDRAKAIGDIPARDWSHEDDVR